MAEVARISIKINSNAKKATKEMRGLDKQLKGVSDQSGSAQKASQGFSKSLGSLLAPVAAVAAGVTAVIATMKKLEEAYAVQEQAEARLAAVLRATGEAAGFNQTQLQDMASGLQEVTTFGDEAIIGMQSLLLTFKGIQGEAFERTQSLALDLSAAFGQDLKSSAIQLGKALEDPTTGLTALRRIGVSFTEAQKEMIKQMQEAGDVAGAQGIILDTLEGQVGGVAEAMADTATGATQQLRNSWGDLMEQMGKGISETLRPAREALTNLINGFIELNQEMDRNKDVAAGVATEITTEEFNKAFEATQQLTEAQERLRDTRRELANETDAGMIDILSSQISRQEKNLIILENELSVEMQIVETYRQERALLRNAALETQVRAENAEVAAEAAQREAEALAEQEIINNRIAGVAEDRRAAQEAYNKSLFEAGVRLQQGLIDEEGFQEASVNAADSFADALINIGYDGIGEQAGDILLRNMVDIIKAGQDEIAEALTPEQMGSEGMAEAYAALEEAAINWGDSTVLQFERVAEAAQVSFDQIQAVASAFTSTLGAFADLRKAQIASEEEALRARGATEEEVAAATLRSRIKLARQEKAQATFSAIVSTASSIVNALEFSKGNPVLAAILTSLYAAQGAVQIAAIQSQPIPQAQFGGSFQVPPGMNQDGGLLRVNSGERVDVTPARGGGGQQVIKLQLGDREFTQVVEDVFNKKGGQIRNANAVRLK